MLLVPRQLVRAGMTGEVPSYGGRLTPVQPYAASHPPRRPPPSPSPRQHVPAGSAGDALAALQHLDTGVISAAMAETWLAATDRTTLETLPPA
jgi:hypothetical protein